MPTPSDPRRTAELRKRVIGLGEHSVRKNYYGVLQERMSDLERFRALLDGSGDAIFLVHVETGRIDDVNLSAARQMSCDRGDLVARPLKEFFADDIPLEEVPDDPAIVATDLVSCNEHRIPVEVGVRFVSFEDVAYAVVVARDVAEKRAAEQALHESEQRYISLLESWPVPIGIYAGGIVRYANRAALDAIGARDASQIIGRNLFDFVHPDSRDLARDRARQFMAGAHLGPAIERFLTLDGRTVVVHETSTPVVFRGEPAVQVIMQDITQEVRSKELLDALRHIVESMRACPTADDVLLTATRDVMSTLGAERAVVLVREDGRWAVRFAPNALEVIHTKLTLEDVGLAEADLEAGSASLQDADAGGGVAIARFLGARTIAAVPAVVGDEPAAAMVFLWSEPTRDFSQLYLDFLGRLSTSVSLALQRIHAFQAERRVAEALQQALTALPRRVGGVDFAHRYEMASEAARIGGGFYDLFELDNDRVGIAIGDVTAKGLEAATVTSIIRAGIRSAARVFASPAEVLWTVNRITSDEFDELEDRFGGSLSASAFLGVLNTRSRELVCASAGHTRPIVVPKQGSSEWLSVGGPELGSEGAEYRDTTVILDPDDTLLLYTGGAIAERGPRGSFGEKGLERVANRSLGLPPEGLIAAMFEAIEDYAGGRVQDDVALLALRVH